MPLFDEVRVEVEALHFGAEPKKKRGVPKNEADIRVRKWLLANSKADPDAVTVSKIAAATGVSRGAVSNNSMWQAFHGERKRRRTGKVRTVPLTGGMLVVMPAETADDPADIAAENENATRSAAPRDRAAELAALIDEQQLDADDRRPARRERSRRS